MSLPGNGIFVVRGEMSTLMTAMRRGSRWNATTFVDDEKDGLMKLFVELKSKLTRIEDLRLIDPNDFLAPFLEVIRTDETTGAVTSLALASINKFLSYGLIDPTSPNLAVTVENIVDAVTHARFMGTDQSSDGVTLFRVVEVLHTLMRSPEGSALTNEAVCEVMLSCFKICFEPRLNELLRRSAEQALKDMVLLLFMRLPQFSEENGDDGGLLKKFQMMAASMEQDKRQRKKSKTQVTPTTTLQRSTSQRLDAAKLDEQQLQPQSPNTLSVSSAQLKAPPLATTPATPAGNIVDMQGKIMQTPTTSTAALDGLESTPTTALAKQDSAGELAATVPLLAPAINIDPASPATATDAEAEPRPDSANSIEAAGGGSSEYINSVGVRFTQQNSFDGEAPLLPYGLPCIQELFRFLILLCNPLDKQNTDTMMHMGLSLLTVAFEVGADNIGKYETLLELVKDDLCRNLIALMASERLTIFAADLQLCFLLFESLRGHLKFQLEAYLKKLCDIVASDNPKTPYEMRELALDNLLQLWRIPGFVAELYINYDCDLYCSDLFESFTKLLSKYTLSATNAVYSTHILAMDALISVIESIERNCVLSKNIGANGEMAPAAAAANRHSRHNSGLEGILIDGNNSMENVKNSSVVVENISKFLNLSKNARLRMSQSAAPYSAIPREQLAAVKHKKRVLSQGTELFNQRPDKGIQYLQENGILNVQLDPMEVALFLRENPGLDKKMIGEYISKKKNVESKILMNFVDSFDFKGLRVDQALRFYLETFRLPGEAPLIFLVLEHFADHWHKQNGEPFDNTDAAFSLAYAIIMLNMDQHNSNAKRLNIPMTPEDFLKNLRGLNGGTDFDQEMLSTVFNAIKNDEIVMPAEQTGLVRENYLWKVLLRRGLTQDSLFNYVEDAAYDLDIFQIIWGASLSALSFMFDKSNDTGYQRTLAGFTKCAGISAHYNLHADFDALVLTLCKFSTLLNTVQPDAAPNTPAHNDIVQAVNFGLNPKAQAALKTVFVMVHEYGDCLREGWKSILDVYLQLFRMKLLPKSLMEVEDFCEPNGKVLLTLEKPSQKQEAGLFSSLYSYLSSEGQREPSYEEQEFIKLGKKCIKECQLDQMIQESKFVQLESLHELLKTILATLKAPNAHKSVGLPYAEDAVVFWMEFLVKIVIHNRDRMIPLWPNVRDQMYLLLMGSASCGYDYLLNRSIVALLKLAIYLMRNEELCPVVLQSLKMLLMLKPAVILRISKQISIGIYELLKTAAQNIHSEQDWQIIFTILECVGAGAVPPEFDDAALPAPNVCAKSDGALSSEEDSGLPDRGYISDSELAAKQQQQQQQQHQQLQQQQSASQNGSPFVPSSPTAENWILVNKDTDLSTLSRPQSPPDVAAGTSAASATTAAHISTLIYNCQLIEHSPFALFKCWDSLAFIVRNVAHITPYNFECCVRCIRTFVEACRDGGIRQRRKFEAAIKAAAASAATSTTATKKQKQAAKRLQEKHDAQRQHKSNEMSTAGANGGAASSSATHGEHETATSAAQEEDLAQRYETLSIQLLDLMYTLYTRTAQIFRWWAEEGCTVPQCSALWAQGWCPLLQGIARLAMDRRREVRTYAISCLQQRALLVHDLQTLSGAEWAACFKQVLFPLLNELLPDSTSIAQLDVVLLEESRIRTATIMSKVFLHHLTPLIELGDAFNALWLEILDYIERFMQVGSDMLSEQMQEILKNMLLVMHSVRVFHHNDGTLHRPLWQLTWQRIGEFLPHLKEELFRDEGDQAEVMSHVAASNAAANINIANLPEVAIMPMQQQQQNSAATVDVIAMPAAAAAAAALQSVSPMESPRHSIILQPPVADLLQGPSFILAQQPPPQNMPMLVPQQQHHHHHHHQQQPSAASSPSPSAGAAALHHYNYNASPLLMQPAPMLVQPIPVQAAAAAAVAAPNAVAADVVASTADAARVLPDLVYVAPDLVNIAAYANHVPTPTTSPTKSAAQVAEQQQHLNEQQILLEQQQQLFLVQQQQQQQQQYQQQFQQQQQEHAAQHQPQQHSYNNYEFSIELPEIATTSAASIAALQQQQHQQQQQQQQELSTADTELSEQHRMQQEYQQYYQHYQQHLMQQQQLQAQTQQHVLNEQQQQLAQNTVGTTAATSATVATTNAVAAAAVIATDAATASLDIVAAASVAADATTAAATTANEAVASAAEIANAATTAAAHVAAEATNAVAAIATEATAAAAAVVAAAAAPAVPISHLLAGNQYPSLAKMPSAAIVQSFTPVYQPPAAVAAATQNGAGDIYQEYVQNPYNLTLQQQQHAQQFITTEQQQQEQQQHLQEQQQQHQLPPTHSASLFAASPANYFNVNVDPSAIPPGSEMLYGQP